MRASNQDPNKRYADFRDWLRDDWHIYLVVALPAAYTYYLATTTEL